MPPKMTAKYRYALGAARNAIAAGKALDRHVLIASQEDLYASLRGLGLMWDSEKQEWFELATEPADDPTPFIRIRVWAEAEIVAEAADLVVTSLKKKGFKLVEASEPYPCRPPKQLESRIYLNFMPPEKKS